ncbi:MAG: nucleotidyltransferase domain-containing protein [Spirulinaceae cyanobacterium]
MQSLQQKIEPILAQVTQWASMDVNIIALALVGSYAKGDFRFDSDIDLMFLTPDPLIFKNSQTWIKEIDWQYLDLTIKAWEDINYGVVWSRHIYFTNQTEIEFSFGFLSWASINPLEIGTFRVVNNGCRILYDPKCLLQNLLHEVKSISQK